MASIQETSKRPNSKDKYTKLKKADGSFTDMPEEQVKILSEFFGKEFWKRTLEKKAAVYASYDEAAVDDLRQIDNNLSIVEPISLAELKATLKKQSTENHQVRTEYRLKYTNISTMISCCMFSKF